MTSCPRLSSSVAVTLAVGLLFVVVAIGGSSGPLPEKRWLALPTAEATSGSLIFYGSNFEGDAFVWCLDRSLSTGWTGELDRVKQETRRAIADLSPEQEFSVVSFASTTFAWSIVPRPANLTNKILAGAWVDSLVSEGTSCMEEALILSLNILMLTSIPGKAILHVADAPPICNGVDTGNTVVANVTALNAQEVEINAVYTGADSGGIVFMQTLASANGGKFVLVQSAPPAVPNFIRGDSDGDAAVIGLADGIFLLRYQFVLGTPAPSCLDSADADDDGAVSGILDGIYILSAEFIPGSPPPPDPGPFACGPDPTADSLGCEGHPCF